MIYAPRPTSEDLDAKYRYLLPHGPIGVMDPEIPEIDGPRKRQMFVSLRRFLPRHPCRILDYGGGDGRLLEEFVERGDDCYLVDYSVRVIRGVTKLADTLKGVEPGAQFDIIICSHVLEHVFDPLEVLSALRGLLVTGGVLFVEVPLELWRSVPLASEPVTHVNFFSDVSMQYLLARSGYSVARCTIGEMPLSGNRCSVVRAFARNTGRADRLPLNGYSRTLQLISPNLATRVGWLMRQPSRILPAVAHRTSRRHVGA